MELCRQDAWVQGDPGFACPPLALRPASGAAYTYSPPSPPRSHDSQAPSQEAGGAPADAPGVSPLDPCLQPSPANFAALRCSWTHPAVISLVAAQAVPGVSLAAGAGAPLQPASLWSSNLPSLAAARPPAGSSQLQSLAAAAMPAGQPGQAQAPATLQQPSIYVGHQDDWLELSPAMLPLWSTVPFEPFAGPKPVQYFVLCPDDLQSQALLFLKDVGAHYELCNLGGHHSAPGPAAWLYTFSTAHPPTAGSPAQQRSAAHAAWDALPAEQRYLLGLRSAAGQLQRTLRTSALALRAGGSALEVNLGATPVVYVVCPPCAAPGLPEAALLEAACCLAPCTPLGAVSAVGGNGGGSRSTGKRSRGGGASAAGQGGGGGRSAAAPAKAAAGGSGQRADAAPWDPATPEPGVDRAAADAAPSPPGAGPMDADTPPAAAPGGAAGGGGGREQSAPPRERYQGAAECLFQRQRCDGQRAAQPEVPQGQAPPLDIVLQVVGGPCLSDLSGQAARATAFELYLKIRRRPLDPTVAPLLDAPTPGAAESRLPQPLHPAAAQLPLVPFCSEPLIILSPRSLPHQPLPAAAAQQQQQQQQASTPSLLPLSPGVPASPGLSDMPDLGGLMGSPGGSSGMAGLSGSALAEAPAQPPRTLHCCYALPPDLAECTVMRRARGGRGQRGGRAGGRRLVLLVPAAWTDSVGELLHCEVLEVDLEGPSGPELSAGGGGALARARSLGLGDSPQGLAAAAVLGRSAELLGHLRANAAPPNLLQHIAIARLGGLPRAERAAWARILSDRALLLPDVSPAHHLAVVGLEAPPPTRLATPSGGAGAPGALVLYQQGPPRRACTALALLPSDDPAALTLPGEHDVLRELRLAFVPGSSSGGGGGGGTDATAGALAPLVSELYGLALLTAAHFALLWGGCAGGGGGGGAGGPPSTAHLPLHAYFASGMLRLLRLLCRQARRAQHS